MCVFAYASVLFCFVLRERKNMKYGGKEEDLGGVGGGGEKNMNKIYCIIFKKGIEYLLLLFSFCYS